MSKDNANADIRKKAKTIILDAYKSVALSTAEGLNIVETENGEIGFHFAHSSRFGRAKIYYSPQPYIEHLLEVGYNQIEKHLNLEDSQDIPPMPAEDVVREAAFEIAQVWLAQLGLECAGFVLNQPVLAKKTFEFLNSETLPYQKDAERNKQIAKIIETVNKYRRKAILEMDKQQRASISAPQFIFCDIYDQRTPVWKKAKAFYRKNKNLPNVLKTTKTAFPGLDQDLIDKFPFRGEEGEPAALAFESVSRHLSIPPAQGASPTSRKRYLAKSRNQRRSVSCEDAENAYKKYLSVQKRRAERLKQIQQIMNNSPNKTS